ncbi:helicase HerA-like domain-containing protein, partial [Mesorhizobium sp.]|uniref:helicase HerA-like domain-containing protein n=1 Tax=Mesorhizobium sp. TaxID=1871066 RepID=UPI0025C29300
RPPSSRLGPITPDERRKIIAASPVAGQYDQLVDRESAFEILQKKTKEAQDAEAQAQRAGSGGSRWTIPGFDDVLG